MNELSNLKPPKGARRNRKRVGRGPGSGTGKTAGRGMKGQKARASSKKRPGFEGGQMPMQRRLPKRGFTPLSRTPWQIVNLARLADRFEAGDEVTPETLLAKGLIRKVSLPVKVLGNGDLEIALTVKAHKFSKSAEDKITGSGGTVEVLGAEVVSGG